MQYKAIIFDLDGTAIESKKDALPSQRVITAVRKAQEKVKVSVATGRSFSFCKNVLESLHLSSPCIISGGSQILNPQTRQFVWEKTIPKQTVEKIIELVKEYPYVIELSDDLSRLPAKDTKPFRPVETIVYIHGVMQQNIDLLLNKLSGVSGIAANLGNSFVKDAVDINITHSLATKEHALTILLEMLHLDTKDIVAVGDSNNDLALFKNVGYKVAMGNATAELKAVADFIAPSIEEDGLAQVIERLILKE